MNDLWKIIVLVVKQMLHIRKPLFDDPKNISITVSDDIRVCTFRWNKKDGDLDLG